MENDFEKRLADLYRDCFYAIKKAMSNKDEIQLSKPIILSYYGDYYKLTKVERIGSQLMVVDTETLSPQAAIIDIKLLDIDTLVKIVDKLYDS